MVNCERQLSHYFVFRESFFLAMLLFCRVNYSLLKNRITGYDAGIPEKKK